MGKFLQTIFIIGIISTRVSGQDLGVFQALAPTTGCELGNSEPVSVQIFNFGTAFTGSFDVSYTINNGPAVTETINLPFTFLQNSTYTYTFTTSADLSVPGVYSFDFYTTLAGDVNNSNDSILDFLVESYQMSEGGQITTPQNPVCQGNNSGALSLDSQVGNVLNWEFSTNGGASWSNIATTNPTFTFSNLTNETMFRALVKNGTCPNDYSQPITILLDQPTVGGTTSGPSTACFGTNSGDITLSGYNGDIVEWEYSEDGGASWLAIANTNPIHTYSNLTTSTKYRVKVKNGSCSSQYSTESLITVVPLPVGGTTATITNTVCSGSNSGSITLTGHVGQVDGWEYTEDGTNWIAIPGNLATLNFTDLLVETSFRAKLESCGLFEYSTATTIYIDLPSLGGEVSGGGVFCEEATNVDLTLFNHQGDILDWEFSSALSPTWTSLSSQNTSISLPLVNETTIYRAIVKNGTCPEATSSIETIFIDALTVPGNISGDLLSCKFNGQGSLEVVQSTGNVLDWEKSLDGTNWTGLSIVSNNYIYQNLPVKTYYRAEVANGTCPPAFTSPVLVNLSEHSVAGPISGNAEVCAGSNLGAVTLDGFLGDISWQFSNDSNDWNLFETNNISLIEYEDLAKTTFYRAVVTNGVCPSDTSGVAIVKTFPLNNTIQKNKEIEIKRGESVAISAGEGSSYIWEPATGIDDPTTANPMASPEESTNYTVIIKDENGCKDTGSVKVNVSLEYELKISNLVTPNGDNHNDYWFIDPPYLKPYVMVFGPNGKVIYESESYDNSWGAGNSGATYPDGVYYYLVKLNGKEYRGALNILRGY